jgi:hypothetical protein
MRRFFRERVPSPWLMITRLSVFLGILNWRLCVIGVGLALGVGVSVWVAVAVGSPVGVDVSGSTIGRDVPWLPEEVGEPGAVWVMPDWIPARGVEKGAHRPRAFPAPSIPRIPATASRASKVQQPMLRRAAAARGIRPTGTAVCPGRPAGTVAAA